MNARATSMLLRWSRWWGHPLTAVAASLGMLLTLIAVGAWPGMATIPIHRILQLVWAWNVLAPLIWGVMTAAPRSILTRAMRHPEMVASVQVITTACRWGGMGGAALILLLWHPLAVGAVLPWVRIFSVWMPRFPHQPNQQEG